MIHISFLEATRYRGRSISQSKYYDHGEARNKLLFEKGKEYKLAGRKIDVKVSGGENLKYLTDEEIDSYCP